jgi:hypothetical protein
MSILGIRVFGPVINHSDVPGQGVAAFQTICTQGQKNTFMYFDF